MDRIVKHIEKIIVNVVCSDKEKEDLKLQFMNHLSSLKDEYIENGFSENEAISLAIKDFGNGSELIKEFKYYNTPYSKKIKYFGLSCSIIYFLFLYLALFNPMRNTAQWVAGARMYGGYLGITINVIPLKTIWGYIVNISYSKLDIFLFNIFGNILLFIPLGIILCLILDKARLFRENIKIALVISLIIEVIRAILPLGVSDIAHVILHITGAAFGWLIYDKLLSNVFAIMLRKIMKGELSN